MYRKSLFFVLVTSGTLLLAVALARPTQASKALALTPIESLGKALYFDRNLSKNGNQSCATCHDPAVGFAGGGTSADSEINAHGAVYPGSDPAQFGNRKPPSAAYAGDSQALRYDPSLKAWTGGMFWDGRADGSLLDDPLAEQAKGPFLNPLEMALASPEELCSKVKAGGYAAQFEQVWGTGSLDCTKAVTVYDQVGKSVAAYERSPEVNPYSSKFDLFWDTAKAKGLDVTQINTGNWTSYRNLALNDMELYGLAVFKDPTQANCASCHSLKPGSKGYPLLTNYSYANLGIPKNPENPFYKNLAYNPQGAAWVDTGLGGHLETVQPQAASQENGKVKVPTLRNVDKRPSVNFVRAYGHNGYFKALPEVIHFYVFRSMSGMMSGMMGGGMGGAGMGHGRRGGMGGMMMGGMMFPQPEVNSNIAALNMFRGRDQWYVLAFLATLSDGYFQR